MKLDATDGPRRRALAGMLGWLVLGGLACEGPAPERASPPNVLLVTLDTLRPDFLGAYGATHGASPALDRLAEQSVVFDRAIAASPRTVPSHASIMTSRFVREHAVGWLNGSTRLDTETTVAERFAEAGYDTAAIVGNMQLRHLVGLDAGFDRYDDDFASREANRPRIRERRADDTTRRALDWLRRERDRPWFLWLHYQDAHGPYTPPAEHLAAVDRVDASAAPLPVLDQNRGEGGVPAYQALPGDQRPSVYVDRYAAEIHFLDEGLGRVLKAIDGGDRPTIVLVTADHGESMGEEGWWFSHGFRTTPDQVHVPLLLRAPGLAPARSDALVHHVDVAPTLLALAGLEPLPGASGLDLSVVLAATAAPDRWVYADVGFETSAYRRDVFLRIESGDAAAPGRRRWARWSSTRDWSPLEAPSVTVGERAAEVDAHRALEPAMAEVVMPSRAEHLERLRQLRALGYVEAGEEEERPPSSAPRGSTQR